MYQKGWFFEYRSEIVYRWSMATKTARITKKFSTKWTFLNQVPPDEARSATSRGKSQTHNTAQHSALMTLQPRSTLPITIPVTQRSTAIPFNPVRPMQKCDNKVVQKSQLLILQYLMILNFKCSLLILVWYLSKPQE